MRVHHARSPDHRDVGRPPNGVVCGVEDGTYPPGRANPSLVKLTAEFGVAQMTVLKAIRSLKDEGLLAGPPGRGTYVTER